MNIFVGNLSFEAKEIDVQRAFMAFGVVTSVAIVMEKKGKKSRGFGFVEMPDEQEALAAIATLDGKSMLGRPINVMSAESKGPKKQSSQGSAKDPLVYRRTGKYKEGRRTVNYLKKRRDAGITTPVVEPRYKPNPMRWPKKAGWAAPAQKTEGAIGSGQKRTSVVKPWRKSSVDRDQPNFKNRSSSAKHKR